MFLNKIVGVLCWIFVTKVHGKVTDEEYSLMPPLFHLDDFDRCMFLEQKALYCSVTVQLAPSSSNYSQVWRIIQAVISSEKSYRHDWLRHGICVPQSCPKLAKNASSYKGNDQFLKAVLSECYSDKYEDLGLKGDVTQLHCETNEPLYATDIYDISVAICLIILVAIVAFASYYEGCARYKTKEEYDKITKTTIGAIICCFSLPKNWKRLSSKNASPDAAALKCINGVRFYNMVLVVMAHACMVSFASPISNPRFTETITEDTLNMIILNGNYVIQTFLLLTGWLLSYHFFLTFEGQKEVRFKYIVIAFINRYIRLTPCLLIMIAINGTWLYHFGRGPSWNRIVGDEYRNCRKNWWANLLYINNYYDIKHMCLIQTWYLAADTQLFLLALIIVMFMWKYQRHIKTILAVSLAVGMMVPGVINYIYSYDILIREYPEPLYNILLDVPEWNVMVISGYTNISGYVVGIIFGYMFYKYRREQLFTKKFQVALWWILTWGLPLSMVFIGIPLYDENYEYSRLGAAVYVALAKTLFTVGISIGIFGVSQGIGWFLRDCVVWSPLQVLGRLTYCVYLVHVSLIRIRTAQARSPSYVTKYTLFLNTLGDLIVAYIFAVVLCLFVELPTSALQKLMVPQLAKKRREGILNKPTEQITRVTLVNGDDQMSKI